MIAKTIVSANKKFDAHNQKMIDTKATDMIKLETTTKEEVDQLMDYLYVQLSEEQN